MSEATNNAVETVVEKITRENLPKPKLRTVEMSEFLRTEDGKIDTSENVREVEVYSKTHPKMEELMGQILQHREGFGGSGLKEHITVVETPTANGTFYRIVKGYRRVHALEHLGWTGKVEALVYPALSPRQFFTLLLDHSDRLDLNAVEAYTAISKAIGNRTHTEIATDYRPLLETISKTTADQEKKNEGEGHSQR